MRSVKQPALARTPATRCHDSYPHEPGRPFRVPPGAVGLPEQPGRHTATGVPAGRVAGLLQTQRLQPPVMELVGIRSSRTGALVLNAPTMERTGIDIVGYLSPCKHPSLCQTSLSILRKRKPTINALAPLADSSRDDAVPLCG